MAVGSLAAVSAKVGISAAKAAMIFIKFILCIFFGVVGGIKGVNTRKTKVR